MELREFADYHRKCELIKKTHMMLSRATGIQDENNGCFNVFIYKRSNLKSPNDL